MLWREIRSAIPILVLAICVARTPALAHPTRLSSAEDYRQYIDALIQVPDFGTRYIEDGAADATVVAPERMEPPYGSVPPVAPVAELLRLGLRGLPVLIDCLSDGRITSMRFDGNTITKAMNVPVGYVCLDILMTEVKGRPAIDPDCGDDGLGACLTYGFYFRPDDYFECGGSCFPRPWINIVQQHWRRAYLSHQLRVRSARDFLQPQR